MATPAHRTLVTGGAGGLGSAISRSLVKAGGAVAIGYVRNKDRAEALASELGQTHPKAVAVKLDVSDPASVADGVAFASAELGGLSAVVTSAGMASGGHQIAKGDLEAFTPDIWDRLMDVNVRGPFLVARAATPYLRASGQGRIVTIGSTISRGPWGAEAIYAPSKGAVEALTRFLAASLAPDIAVNMVAPGLMEGTDMSGGAPDAYVRGWKDRAVLGRTTDISDVARQVVALIESETITGQTITVDGGIHFG